MTIMIIGGLLILVGLGTAAWNYRDLHQSRQIATWPVIEGTVIVSVVEPVTRGGGAIERPISVEEARIAAYRPLVIFEYVVDGRSYLGNAFSYASGARQWAEAHVQAHPVGSMINAYHDPRTPQYALGYHPEHREARSGIIIGSLVFLGAVVGALVGLP